MQHLQFLSTELANQQIPQEVQMQLQQIQAQMQQMSPSEAMVMQQQIQITIDQYSAPIMAQLTAEFLQSIGQGQSSDPLVDIRKSELALRDKQLDIEADQFTQKQNQRAQEKMAENQLQKDRINVQKDIADDKLGVAMDRLQQNAELKLLELGAKQRN